jgi:hypothetical protein
MSIEVVVGYLKEEPRIFLERQRRFSVAWVKFEPGIVTSGVPASVVVKAVCYKLEGRWFEIRWREWNVPIYIVFPAALGHGVYSATNRYDYEQKKN